MYSRPFGHLAAGHAPDKIKNRLGLYLEYVKLLAAALSESGDGQVDMFTFEYIAASGHDTNQNSAILETEVRIRTSKAGQIFNLGKGDLKKEVSKYIDHRNRFYGKISYVIHVVPVDHYQRQKNGTFKKTTETRTFVEFK